MVRERKRLEYQMIFDVFPSFKCVEKKKKGGERLWFIYASSPL